MISGGFEPPTAAVLRLRSTPELRNHVEKTRLYQIYTETGWATGGCQVACTACSITFTLGDFETCAYKSIKPLTADSSDERAQASASRFW